MTELEKMQRAKMYVDKLANGVNPLDDTPVNENDIVNNVRISRCLFYISEILDLVIQNNGVINSASKTAFTASKIDRNEVKTSDTPLQISTFAKRINDLADSSGMKRIGPSKISKWLISRGYLAENTITVQKEIKEVHITPKADEIGLVVQEKVDTKTGEVKNNIVLTRSAQQYILDNLESISQIDAKQ